LSSQIALDEFDEGISKSIENASRYLNDALLLARNGRYQSSILLSMLSYEESGKALLMVDFKKKKKEITKTQWVKVFCDHKIKNIASRRRIWQSVGFTASFSDWDRILARFDQEWKEVFAYVDYDFRNNKWTAPSDPRSFGLKSADSFCKNAMLHAADALEAVMKTNILDPNSKTE
jgi:AbiV family abortive infection protein